MNTPEGYVSIGLVGFTDKGNYLGTETYVKNDLVHEDNAIWQCLVDDCIGVNPRTDDTGHWKLWIDSENDASGITVVDKKGVLEESEKEIDLQDFLDEIADRVVNKLLTKAGLVNNGLATKAGVAALDSAYGKTLLDKINTLNSNLSYSVATATLDTIGLRTYYHKYGYTKSIYFAGTDSGVMEAGTEYILGTIPDTYLPKTGFTKNIIYKRTGGVDYVGYLSITSDGKIKLQPHNVCSGGIIYVHEIYI